MSLNPKTPSKQMKTLTLVLACAVMAAGTLCAQTASTTTTVTTSTGTGTLSEYTPGSTFIVKESTGPVTYSYGKQVQYVTKSGRVITEPRLKSRVIVGRPVTVHYVTEGDRRVIQRVVMHDKDDDDDDDDDDGK